MSRTMIAAGKMKGRKVTTYKAKGKAGLFRKK